MSRWSRIVALSTLSVALLGIPSQVQAASPATYTVQAGDSLSGIADKVSVRLVDLLTANGLTTTSLILPGMQLALPTGATLPPATAPAAPATPTAASTDGTYTVAVGDSLSRIANRVGTSLTKLLEVNGLTASSLILPGQRLTLPAGSSAPQSAPAPPATPSTSPVGTGSSSSYTIVAGDSLSRIAKRVGTSLTNLLAANGLTASSLILPGQRLALPAGVATPATPAPAQTPPAPAPAPTPSAASTASYTILAGDSLSRIASRHGVSLKNLLAVNSLSAGSLIVPGQQLALPAGATTPTSNTAPGVATPSPTPSPTPSATPAATGNASIDTMLQHALAQVGKPYQFFSAGPDAFDCSGLVLAAYRTIGIQLPHQSAQQALLGTAVDPATESIRPGDLIFLTTHGNATINHVGIAVTSTTYVHAPRSGETVRVGAIPSSVTAVRRFANP